MKNLWLHGLSSLLLPLSAYAGVGSGAGYQRTYLSAASAAAAADLSQMRALPRDLIDLSATQGEQLDIQRAHPVLDLVVVDASVAEADRILLRRALKADAEMVEINANAAGIPQLMAVLKRHQNLAAVHIVSHAEAGTILLGNSRISANSIKNDVQAFAALQGAVRAGGDLLFYGCNLAADQAGEELLQIISHNTGLDVAASNNLTGNAAQGGDWELEVRRGNIEADVAFSTKALQDFSSVLVASNGTKNFSSGWTDNNSNLTSTDFIVTAKDTGGSTISNISIYASAPYPAYIQTGYNTTTTGTYFHVAADGTNTGSFELTGLVAGEAAGLGGQFTNVHIVGIKPDNSTITSSTINGTGTPDETFTFAAGQLTSFSGVKLKAFKLVFDTTTGSGTKPFFEFRNFTITGAQAPLPVVSDGRISISGASGTGGAYKIGDTVSATWNNTAGGDNNTGVTGVTMDFSQFGGGAAVAASNSSNTWTATYTITAGAIDTTNRNVSVTATNAGGSTTTADTTNATVDNVAPTVSDGRISISGASGTGGAFKIGDTVTATWNNTAGGDNNSDTISAVTVNFSAFGGGAAVSASNSAGTWTATYTIVAGAIDNTNRNIAVTATDNAGNTTTTADTSNATVDNIAPVVSSITPSGGAVSGDTAVDFIVDFSESVSNISTDDFTAVVTGSAAGSVATVSASSGDPVTVTVGAISGSGTLKINLNSSTNVVDDAGNSIAAYSSGTTHTVNVLTAPDAPTIGAATPGDGQASVAFTAPVSNGGSAITGYTVTSNPGSITGGGNGFTTSPIIVTGLTNGTAYTFTVTATNAIGNSTASGATAAVTPKADQIITFANPGAQNFGTTPTLTATSNSVLTVEFSSVTTGVCTVTTGGALTFVTAGSCTIHANQNGNTAFNAAPTVVQTFSVTAVVPDAPTIGTATEGDAQASVTFSAPANTGGASISGYTVTSNPGGLTGTGAGSPITVTGLTNGVAYTFTVTATNSAGTGSASSASNSITPAAPQTITFANPGAQTFGTTPTLSASSTSGLTVTFTSSTTGVCTITSGGALTFVTAGTCTINADQAGDSSYLPASQVSRSFTVDPANQTITFTNPGAQNYGSSPTLSATSTSGLTVTFSSATTGVCTITSGGALTFVTAGSCTIDADQAGDATTNAAATVSRTFTVNAVVPDAPTIGTATEGDAQASVTFSAPANTGGASISGYTVTSNPGGLTGTGAGSPITVTGLTNGVAYTFTVTATNSAGTGSASSASNSITPAAPQTITFANPGAQSFGTTPTLSASSTSGLTVTFTSSTTGVCTITSGGALTFVTAGTCTINADQAGDSSYLPASQVSRSFTVSPVIAGAPTIGTATAGDTQASVAFTAPVNTGGTTITGYTVSVSPADVAPVNGAGSPIVVTGLTNGQAYTFTVTADNAAGTSPSSAASNSITPKANQTITFANPGAQNFGTTPTLTATADSGLTVSFTSSTTGVCTITSGGALTFVTVGTCTINADQAGNGSYLAATQVSRSFTVNAVVPGAPTAVVATAGVGQASVSFNAPGFTGGNSIISYTVTSSPGGITASGAGSPIVVTGLSNGQTYSFTVTATNGAGTGNASAASATVTLPADQIITFANPGAQNFGTTPTLTATADSGLTVTFTSSTTGVCTITSGGLLTLLSPGTCTINADQAGNGSYLPATQVSRSFTVDPVVPGAPVIGTATVIDGSSASVSFAAPAFTGGSAVTSYTVSSIPGGFTASGTGSPLTVTGLTAGTSYSFVVTATNSAGTSAASGASNSVTPQSTQTITFANPGAQNFGSTPTLTATADSGLTVTFTSSTTGVCTITSGGALTFVTTGTCTIHADQAGNGSYLAATQISHSFTVNPVVPDAPGIGEATVIGGNSVSVSFTEPFFTGGSAVTSYRVSSIPGGVAVSGSGSPLTVTGLTAGTSYSFVVTATNSAGTSAASAISNSVVPTDPNTAPVIGGTPAAKVKVGAAYGFTPTASDVDANDTLSFSISNKPGWASFSTSNGSLTGTPAQTDAGVSNGIVISVSDGKVSTSLPAFSVEVLANTAPVATPGSSTLNEDEPASIELGGTDADGDVLTVQIQTQPQHGTLTQSGNAWLYTPQQDFNGADSLSFIVKDAMQSSAPATYTLTVTPVNDAPVAVDDVLSLARSSNDQYVLNVLGNDKDVDGDSLQLAGASAAVGTVTVSGTSLNYTAPAQYTGPVELRYSVSDGKKGLATATVSLTITGAANDLLPVITVPADIEVNATALFTRVSLGTATAVDRNGRRLRVSLINGSLFFAPGVHQVYWQATDADGNTATKKQEVRVNPLISLSKNQVVSEGSAASVEVLLNGPAVRYPVQVPYTVSGTAGGNDHTLSSGTVEISSGVSASLQFDVLDDAVSDNGENIVITLGSVNAGSQRSTTVQITENNVAPVLSLSSSQQGENRLTVSRNGGPVTLSATATDANTGDVLTLAWQTSLPLTGTDANSRSVDPSALTPGLYPVSVTATDNGSPAKSATAQLYLVVQQSLPTLTSNDTDGDLIPDALEGFADADRDGIPDYRDAINECNVVPEADTEQRAFLAEGEPGACLRRGQQSILASSGGLELANTEIETDTSAQNIGGIFDFIAYNLPQAGQSYQLILPQRSPVPTNAVYRKYNDTQGWVAFVTDSKNHVRSALGERGFCPPPGDAAYTAGLTAGHWCVQVTVEDGGPNDADGLVNAAIVDPGGVAVPVSSNKLPQAKPDTATTRMNQPVTVKVLVNDTDADNDTLTVSQAVANFGAVKIETDGTLTYTPAKDYVGSDVVVYSISDGKGGTSSSELTVTVRLNNLPVTGADSAATDDRTAISINVLGNDTDADSDPLKVISASALTGTVTIEADNRLRYTPKAGFSGTDTVSYRVSDGFGGEANGQVNVTVTAYQSVTVSNKSSGGAASALWLTSLLLLGFGRRYGALLLLPLAGAVQAGDWQIQLGAGQSKVSQPDFTLQQALPAGTVRSIDDSDRALSLSLQYQLFERLDAEVGYLDLGEGKAEIAANTLTPAQYHQAVRQLTPVLGDGVFAGLRIGLWQQDGWRLQLPLGMFSWKSDLSSTMNGSTLESETDGTDLYYGLALQYLPDAHWAAGISWQQVALEPEDVQAWQFTLSYRF